MGSGSGIRGKSYRASRQNVRAKIRLRNEDQCHGKSHGQSSGSDHGRGQGAVTIRVRARARVEIRIMCLRSGSVVEGQG